VWRTTSSPTKRRSLHARWSQKVENRLALFRLDCTLALLNLTVSGRVQERTYVTRRYLTEKTRGEAPMSADGKHRQEFRRSLWEQNLTRTRFLRLAGTGLGLSITPSSLTFWRGVPAFASTSPLLSDGQYPIGLFWPPPPDQTTVERYQEIAAADFNFVIGGNGVTNDSTNPAALDAAAACNLRFLLVDGRLRNTIHNSTAAASTSVQKTQEASIMQSLLTRANTGSTHRATISATSADSREDVRLRILRLMELYGGYPSLAGLSLYDEPSRELFGIVGYAKEVLQGLAAEQLPYVNIWPSYASLSALGTSSYEEYLSLYLSEVNPPLLSFDHYPLLSGMQITANYFYNWALIRRYSLQAGIPSWAYIQSAEFGGSGTGISYRRSPNAAEIRWQINVSLAYGAKGVQYFTYWTPISTGFVESLVSRDGVLTPLYTYAKRANNRLKVVGKVLLPLTSESVVHANENPLPKGARAFKADGYIKSVSGSSVILGRFRDPAGGTERYLLVTNRSFANAAQTVLSLSGSVSKVLELDNQTGAFVSVAQQGSIPLSIAPGGARLYLLRNN